MIRRIAYLPVVVMACVVLALYWPGLPWYASVLIGGAIGYLGEDVARYMDARDAARRRKAVRP